MIPFKELQNLADKCRARTGLACNVSVSYWCYTLGNSELSYNLYIENSTNGTQKFKTVREFKAAIASILTPTEDTGVEVSTKAT